MSETNPQLDKCLELLKELEWFKYSPLLRNKLESLISPQTFEDEYPITINVMWEFWQIFKTYFNMTVKGKELYNLLYEMFGSSDLIPDCPTENMDETNDEEIVDETNEEEIIEETNEEEIIEEETNEEEIVDEEIDEDIVDETIDNN